MPGLGKFEMRKVFTLIFVCCAIGSSHAESEWNLIWHDEFDGRVLNSGKWRQEVGFLRNREVQYYTSGRKENLRVENGKLVIEARLEGFVNPAYDPQHYSPAEVAEKPVRIIGKVVELRGKF